MELALSGVLVYVTLVLLPHKTIGMFSQTRTKPWYQLGCSWCQTRYNSNRIFLYVSVIRVDPASLIRGRPNSGIFPSGLRKLVKRVFCSCKKFWIFRGSAFYHSFFIITRNWKKSFDLLDAFLGGFFLKKKPNKPCPNFYFDICFKINLVLALGFNFINVKKFTFEKSKRYFSTH